MRWLQFPPLVTAHKIFGCIFISNKNIPISKMCAHIRKKNYRGHLVQCITSQTIYLRPLSILGKIEKHFTILTLSSKMQQLFLNLHKKKYNDTYPSTSKTLSVRPVRQAATANMNVVRPKEAWIGTSAALKAAVAPSQHNKTRKLKNPTINCN